MNESKRSRINRLLKEMDETGVDHEHEIDRLILEVERSAARTTLHKQRRQLADLLVQPRFRPVERAVDEENGD
jgi:hypothetical protein